MHKISIGIPSYNEQNNIVSLLYSILDNLNEGIFVTEVIISDDSTDSTPQLVEQFIEKKPSLNVRLYHHNERRGAAAAWNEIFAEAKEDIILLLDADTIIDRNCVKQLVAPIEGQIGLCASNQRPVQTPNTISRAAAFVSDWLRSVRKRELSRYTVMGRSLSIRSGIAKQIRIPQNLIAIDLYLECCVMEKGFNVIYNDNAVTYFSPPTSMADFASQVLRAYKGHRQVRGYVSKFSIELSLKSLIVGTMETILGSPSGAIAAFLCYMSIPYYLFKLNGIDNPKWLVAQTTKRVHHS